VPEGLAGAHVASGKVREIYRYGDTLLMVASDRISAFDVVMPTPIPHKGRVLTALSRYWFDQTAMIVPNHMISVLPEAFSEQAKEDPDLIGRSMLVRRLTMLPIECVVRGYLAGSGWKDYQATGAVCGHSLPAGLRESEQLPHPIFTPATKNIEGHDLNIDKDTARLLVGDERLDRLEELSLAVYDAAASIAAEKGLILADTKMEFGIDQVGDLVLGDELLTPDSSRFWLADGYEPGGPQPSLDKQYVRDHLETLDWDKTPPGPELPPAVVEGTQRRYFEAYERLVGEPFETYLQRMGVT
jgi:phosphoribosylaminoimidazole-succinocarboxamide synthase